MRKGAFDALNKGSGALGRVKYKLSTNRGRPRKSSMKLGSEWDAVVSPGPMLFKSAEGSVHCQDQHNRPLSGAPCLHPRSRFIGSGCLVPQSSGSILLSSSSWARLNSSFGFAFTF